jgi:hypothetical protein
MLQRMQQTAQSAPSSGSSSFAGVLAALASPAKRPASDWNDDDLADDVATLSYERALRTHARFRYMDPSNQSVIPTAVHEAVDAYEVRADSDGFGAQTATPPLASHSNTAVEFETGGGLPTTLSQNLKCASITIRLSKTECAQLRKRAAEAGLTVSAYLRSCTFEAESLRALVKDTMSQLKSATAAGKKTAPPPVERSWFGWLKRLLPQWHPSQRMARA